jgi:hypothetical protein
LDSGTFDPLNSDPSFFSELSPPETPDLITLADRSKIQAVGVGYVSPLPWLPLKLKHFTLVPHCLFIIKDN